MSIENIIYTEDQLETLNRLREKRERDILRKKEYDQNTAMRQLCEGDPVHVMYSGKSIPGVVVNVVYSGKISDYIIGFDVSTVYGIIYVQNDSFQDRPVTIRRRIVQVVTDVMIPDELKKISTPNLLRMLRSTYSDSHTRYSVEELKAELYHREHIPSKKEKRIFTELINSQKNDR
jgi:hypothetical protein